MSGPARALSTAVRQGTALGVTGHRPWPLPERPWVVAQSWHDLLFAHWRVPAGAVSDLVPPPFSLDTFDGDAWLGVTPFRVGGHRLRLTLPLPVVSSFLELNVRTYVTFGGKPGVWFFSLDASSALAVRGARLLYKLPYFQARMSSRRDGEGLAYTCKREDPEGRPAAFRGSYWPAGEVFQAGPGSLEHFLVERYCLYALDSRQRVYRGEIHHAPWRLRPAEAEFELNTMPPPELELRGDPLLHLAQRQDTLIWLPERMPAAGGGQTE